MDKKRVIVLSIALMLMSQPAVALKLLYSPPNVLPPFHASNGLQVRLFDGFGDGIYFSRYTIFKYLYIKYSGGTPLAIYSIEIDDKCLWVGSRQPFVMEPGAVKSYLIFRQGNRGLYSCKPAWAMVRTDRGNVVTRF
jgi:hypothetical protein